MILTGMIDPCDAGQVCARTTPCQVTGRSGPDTLRGSGGAYFLTYFIIR
jgi:hypothetical protein